MRLLPLLLGFFTSAAMAAPAADLVLLHGNLVTLEAKQPHAQALAVKGGRIVGDQVKIEQKTLFQNRDFPVLNEYRAVLAGVFHHIYGLQADRLQKVFASVQPKDLALV